MFRRSRRPKSCAVREPHWTRLSSRRLSGCDVSTHAWLSDTGSLTRSIIASCDRGRFAVELVGQGVGSALPSEAALLEAAPGHPMLVREVRLRCGRKAWVYARTLIPQRSLRGPAQALTHLGRRPLGEVLFSDPTTRRLRVEVARITPRHRLFAGATVHIKHKPAEIWGRRTLFDYSGERILVNEIFLPAVQALQR